MTPIERAEREPDISVVHPGRSATSVSAASITVEGASTAYRLHDVGYEIHLDRVAALLGAGEPSRARLVRGEARAIVIPNPPLTVRLGTRTLSGPDGPIEAEASARLFDFGVVSLRLERRAPGAMSWTSFAALASGLGAAALGSAFDALLDELLARIAPAVDRPQRSPVVEDYHVLRIDRLRDERGPLQTSQLREPDLAALVLDEKRELSPEACRELLPHRFSYYADDLALLSWDRALVIEPDVDNTDVEYVLEFANAQLLELRLFDDVLDDELKRMASRVARARARSPLWFGRRFASLLAELQTMVADTTDLVERVENAIRLTDDVYLARIYSAALEIFRGRTWRASIDRKLRFVHDSYEMLNAESQAARAEALEIAIVVLIVAELVLGLIRR